MSDIAVEVRDLVKTFGSTRALDGFDLTVRSGEVAGFLGPNGSGKSTTIRVLLGMLRADAGTARVLGSSAESRVKPVKVVSSSSPAITSPGTARRSRRLSGRGCGPVPARLP